MIDLSTITEEQLLNTRLCELPIGIEHTWLQECVDTLYAELEAKKLPFKPVCYLADEWLTPDGEPVVGIPFFLAHPALIKLEKKMMLEVEGEDKEWCMKLLRHETGHAINYAYKLYRRKTWRTLFGPFDQEYSDTYRFRPYSKNFVLHLEKNYAQYHPDEDFAETFAVWLTNGLDWKKRYGGWGVLKKLLYVDKLMSEIQKKQPRISSGKQYWNAKKRRITLKNYYRSKKRFHAEDFPDFHDENLKKIFLETSESIQHNPYASSIIKKHRKAILQCVSKWTGEKKYIVDDLLKTIMERCKSLKLRSSGDDALTMVRISTYVTTLIMNYLYTGRFRGKK